MKNRPVSRITFYIAWTLVFTVIAISTSRLEELSFMHILIAYALSAIIGIPIVNSFFKMLDRQAMKGENVKLDLLPEEELILKASASLKRSIILLGGVLFLTDNRILFIGSEFFNRNKKLFSLTLNQIAECELVKENRIMIKDNSGQKHTLAVNGASGFLSELKKLNK